MALAVQTRQDRGPTKYQEVVLSAEESATNSFRHIMENVTTHIRMNVAPALEGDPEGIHQLRIGIRRARSALRMFRTMVPSNVGERFDRRLRNYGNTFGKARDWDVFVTKTLGHLPNSDNIREHAVRRQTEAHANVKQTLADSPFDAMLDRMISWAKDAQINTARIEKLAPELLDHLAKKVKTRRRKANINDEQSLHRLRKAVKRLRYGIEFTDSLYRKKRATRYLDEVKESLDLLGDMNDTVVTRSLIAKLDAEDTLQPWLHRQHRKALKKIPKAVDNLRLKAFW